jgi:hypothetical protein
MYWLDLNGNPWTAAGAVLVKGDRHTPPSSSGPTVILGLDPRINLNAYWPPLSQQTVVRAATDARAKPEHDVERTIPTPFERYLDAYADVPGNNDERGYDPAPQAVVVVNLRVFGAGAAPRAGALASPISVSGLPKLGGTGERLIL